jgi:hypothetical protein
MSPPITYLPAYVGLFFSLLLAVTCGAYLDIQYGAFGIEVTLWAVAFAVPLSIAWRQNGVVDDSGLLWQRIFAGIAVVATFFVFLPTWGMPRAGLYTLAALQAATNCVTVNRRKFRMALLASAVMVMFSAAHYRADWTMLFYLVPYIFAVVFTLVAEQVGSRAAAGLTHTGGGQAMAITAAAVAILGVTFVLYSVTPQVTILSFSSKYGQLSNIAKPVSKEKGADGGRLLDGGSGNGQTDSGHGGADGESGQGDQDFANGGVDGPSGLGYRESIPTWPSVAEMRAAAKRQGMPRWQSRSIETVALLSESIQMQAVPLLKWMQELTQDVGNWCKKNQDSLINWIAALIALALLIAAWLLARETRGLQWLRSHFDYLRLGVLGWHAPSNAGAMQFFHAMERLFSLHHVTRDANLNAREYLMRLQRIHYNLHDQSAEAVSLFERARYGYAGLTAGELNRMRQLYRQMYQQV